MSIKHTSLVLEYLTAPPPVKLVAMILADHADADGVCWPSYRRISQLACQSERTVRRHVHDLIKLGVVSKLRTGTIIKRDGKTIRISNAYKIHPHVLTRRPSLLNSTKLSTDDLGRIVENDHLDLATGDTPRRSHLTTKPSLNHQVNRHSKKSGDNSLTMIGDAIEEILKGLT